MRSDLSSKLFHRPGYIPLKEYVDDINHMREYGPWKLPLGMGDRLQLFLLSLVAKFSWFSDDLYIAHPDGWSPAYAVLISYLRRKKLLDSLTEGSLRLRGYFFYTLNKEILVNGQAFGMSGHGVAEDTTVALSKALGEMLERMISGVHDMNQATLIASPDELMKEYSIVYPPKHHRFLAVQKKKSKELCHSSTDLITWVTGENLITKEKTYIPRQMTSWFIEKYRGGNIFVSGTTSGAAGYFTKDGAVLRGVLEAVQRDAFLVHWLTMIPPQIIRPDTLPEEQREKIREFELVGITLYVLNITSLGIPSVCIAALNAPSAVPQIVVSAASAVTLKEAIRDALREMVIAAEMFYYGRMDKQSKEGAEPEPFVSDLERIDRQLYWRGAEKVARFKWFISGASVSYDDLSKNDIQCAARDSHRLEKCLEILRAIGSDYCPVVYFPENTVQTTLGFFVAQVFIPKAFPFYLVERYGTFDSDRLHEFALSQGISDWKLNPLPHMFP